MNSPTTTNYNALTEAFAHFNQSLFNAELPHCLITLQRKGKAYGFFAGERFAASDGSSLTDEIAMNPSHFKNRTPEQVLSTLAHEMCHLWQHHFGKRPRKAYHDKQWAAKMKSIGLIPSDTGEPGGKETGQSVSHYIQDGGPFAVSVAELLGTGFVLPFVEAWGEEEEAKRKAKSASKTKFTCPDCGANAWGKPELRIVCGPCEVAMVGDGGEGGEED